MAVHAHLPDFWNQHAYLEGFRLMGSFTEITLFESYIASFNHLIEAAIYDVATIQASHTHSISYCTACAIFDHTAELLPALSLQYIGRSISMGKHS